MTFIPGLIALASGVGQGVKDQRQERRGFLQQLFALTDAQRRREAEERRQRGIERRHEENRADDERALIFELSGDESIVGPGESPGQIFDIARSINETRPGTVKTPQGIPLEVGDTTLMRFPEAERNRKLAPQLQAFERLVAANELDADDFDIFRDFVKLEESIAKQDRDVELREISARDNAAGLTPADLRRSLTNRTRTRVVDRAEQGATDKTIWEELLTDPEFLGADGLPALDRQDVRTLVASVAKTTKGSIEQLVATSGLSPEARPRDGLEEEVLKLKRGQNLTDDEVLDELESQARRNGFVIDEAGLAEMIEAAKRYLGVLSFGTRVTGE